MNLSALARPAPPALPLCPSVEAWRAMPPTARERFLAEVNAALSADIEAMAESRPHSRAKSKALDKLSQHFRLSGRKIYLATEMAVLYPDEVPFVPDILVVLDVEDPGDADERTGWVVADEGKGLDMVLEIFHKSKESKDFTENVERYARLGIPEYFIYDRRRQGVRGYRLSSPGARRYRELRPRFGRYTSQVLGLDLAVMEGSLRFFQGGAEIFDSEALIAQLGRMVDDLEHRWEDAEARAQQEQARAQEEQARAQEEQARADNALAQLRQSVLYVLSARGLSPAEAEQAQIAACTDAATLHRYIVRALSATSVAAVLQDS